MNLAELATQTEGYSAADLTDLVTRAIHQVAIRAVSDLSSTVCVQVPLDKRRFQEFHGFQLDLTHHDFVIAQTDFVPLSLRDVKLEKSCVSWSDIGGMVNVFPVFDGLSSIRTVRNSTCTSRNA